MKTGKKTTKQSNSEAIRGGNLFSFRLAVQLLNGVNGVKLGKCRAKFSRAIQREIDDMESFKKSSEWFRINRLIDDINVKWADKNMHGDAIIENGMYKYSQTNAIMRDKDIAELKEKEKEAFAIRVKQLDEFKEMLEEEIDVELPKFRLSYFPDDINSEIIDMLWPVIIDDLVDEK